MKALILAAGMGTRLRPLTDKIPKCLVQVNGVPIIAKQIENLVDNGIKDIYIVSGYKSDMLDGVLKEEYPFVNMIVNTNYDRTNNMYSAYLTRDVLYGNEFILMNGDVFFDESVVSELLKPMYLNSIVVEKGVYNDESMKVRVDNTNRIVEISKKIPEILAYGVSIDVYKFSAEGSKSFFEKIREIVEVHRKLNEWTEIALNEILSKVKFEPCPLKGRWVEIDNYEDLKFAEEIFK
ncbi:MAG: phosphocholine cytidylyltransferase family protein [Thermotogaceae bacterium]|nr:phosphocholine cytidylyltransferase family protein [Thermotogaceae bacterium]